MPICQRAQGLGKMKIFGAPGMPSLLKSCMWRGHPLQPISGNKWVFLDSQFRGVQEWRFWDYNNANIYYEKDWRDWFLTKNKLGGELKNSGLKFLVAMKNRPTYTAFNQNARQGFSQECHKNKGGHLTFTCKLQLCQVILVCVYNGFLGSCFPFRDAFLLNKYSTYYLQESELKISSL